MTKLGSTPPGADIDPRAPFNEPEHAWYELFNESKPPNCYGCESDHHPVRYYEPVRPGLYYFYCLRCVMKAWKDSSWVLFENFLKDNNLYSIL
jgi:hypothetical protein